MAKFIDLVNTQHSKLFRSAIFKTVVVSNSLESACRYPKVYNNVGNIQKITNYVPASKHLQKSRHDPKISKEKANI